MARDFAKQFYSSKQWQQCRDEYLKQARGLCERCLDQGRIVPGEIVHHRVELTPTNINDPNITLSFNNLQCVCRECHAAMHDPRPEKRYKISQGGEVIINT